MRDLPLPCKHQPSEWRYRVATHSDAETDAAGGISNLREYFTSVWTCGRAGCLDRAERYVTHYSKRAAVRNEGTHNR